jgi:hypothetical protein
MRRWTALAAVCFLLAAAGQQALADGKITVSLVWATDEGQSQRTDYGPMDLAEVAGRGLWVALEAEGESQHFPGVCVAGEFRRAGTPAEQMKSLELEATVETPAGRTVCRAVLFSASRPFGVKKAAPANVYHLLVLEGTVEAKDLPESLPDGLAPAQHPAETAEWKDAFWRTHRLAMNYAVEADAKRREYEEVFQVQSRYVQPRLILTAEQWLDVPKEVREAPKKPSGGLFGGALDDVADEIAGEKKVVPENVPVYSIDVLLDEVEAKGAYPIGFEAARSIWNDVLEGAVLYRATGGKRRVLTATIVFAQMQKNLAAGAGDARLLLVDSAGLARLDECERLWPVVKEDIGRFLKDHPTWRVLIPSRPVTFYQDDQPIYAMYAYFQVNPETGRMIGVLPNASRGAMSDEIGRMGQTLLEKGAGKVGGGAVKGFFSQVAGMYVSAAGIIDAVGMTIADPSLAAMDGEQWNKFVADHALGVCQKFLEDNAALYDSYAAQAGFWQGAAVLISHFGGADAARQAARNAVEGMADKAAGDARKFVEGKAKAGAKAGREAVDEAAATYAPRLRDAVNGIERAYDHYNQGRELGASAADAVNRFEAAMNEVKTKYEGE